MKMQRLRRPKDDRGAALLSALLVMLLMAGVTAGFTALVITDTRVRALDSTRTQSFYAVHAGLEKLTSDIGDLFAGTVAPTAAQVNALADAPPSDLGVTWTQPDGSNGYRISYDTDASGNPQSTVMNVQQGPFQGLVGLGTTYTMSVTGHLADGSETSLTRQLQTVAIPVFQFGIFSENDLSFFAGPNFNFGGRVHSNSNIFLAEGNGATLTLADRVTSVGEIIRTNLSNGWDTNTNYTGTVNVNKLQSASPSYRALTRSEGSLTGTLGSSQNEPTWSNLSEGTYNHNIMNGRTGARRLDLPIATFGDGPIDLIKRPLAGEDTSNPNLLAERFYSLASLRILLSDTAADITSLPDIDSSKAPIELGATVPTGYTVGAPRAMFAQSPGTGTQGVKTAAGTPLLGGYIKIEKQTTAGTWQDVTLDILKLGINSAQLTTANTGDAGCTGSSDGYSADAVIRLQRRWDSSSCTAGSTVFNNSTTDAQKLVANTLYDPREGLQRDVAPTSAVTAMHMGGIIYYVEIDARNLSKWFSGTLPTSLAGTTQGTNALRDGAAGGFTVYFSDRRGNRNGTNETGEYGFEDIVNPASSSGTPNNSLDTGEDFNGNGTLETYGKTARSPYGVSAWSGTSSPIVSTTTPTTEITGSSDGERIAIARRNPPIFFRRALKLTNGATNLVSPGLTIASENPVYVQGNWNSSAASCLVNCFNGTHVATAVLADAVTLLSNNWNDRNSFANPHRHDSSSERNASTTWYRMAIIAGKGPSFPQPSGTPQDFGTDGGAHNFLRYIEDWDGDTLNYRGSIASMFFSRQATGTYKCCTTVYAPPGRGYNFDTEFLTPALLPPHTPMFRDVNITGFAQIIKP
ncbi:MAG TPA: hypothetical protein VHB78_10020 [Vicinamibacterales bacterium]|jgi:hypothetical protein|nr:hypothetical protein [Vicinamibacterales bacterium]